MTSCSLTVPLPRFSSSVRMAVIDKLVSEYELTTGQRINGISNWNFCEEYFEDVLTKIEWPDDDFSLQYSYSWELGYSERLRKRLAVPVEMEAIVLSNTSQAITLLSALATHLSEKQVVFGPYYWSVSENASMFGADVEHKYLTRDPAGGYEHEDDLELLNCAWITRPPFATGSKLTNQFIGRISTAAKQGTYFLFDEALSNPFDSILTKLECVGSSFSVLSPHKYINSNGSKFAALVFPNQYQDFLEERADSLFGSLPASVMCAVTHFLSSDYDLVLANVRTWITNANREIQSVVDRHRFVELDPWSDGIYRTVYIPLLPASFLDIPEEFTSLMAHTLCGVIPGTRNYSAPSNGLSFRVNLTRNNALYLKALDDVLKHLTSKIS